MQCPKCGHQQSGTEVCEACGIYFEKYRQAQLRKASTTKPTRHAKKPRPRRTAMLALGGVALVGLGIIAFSFDHHSKAKPAAVAQQPTPAPKPTPPPTPVDGVLAQLNKSYPPGNAIEAARNATVFIKTAWGAEGSGFIVSRNCDVVTNKHVVQLDPDDLRKAVYGNPNFRAAMKKSATELAKKIRELYWYRAQLINTHARQYKIDNVESEIKALQKKLASLNQDVHDKIEQKIDIEVWKSADDPITVSLIDGTEYQINDVTKAEHRDLAKFRLPAHNCPFLKFSKSASMHQGDRLFTIGNPEGLSYTVTSGIFSGFRDVKGTHMVQTDAPINPGNSGGPLIQENGEVVGVNTLVMMGAQGIGFAIPIETVEAQFFPPAK